MGRNELSPRGQSAQTMCNRVATLAAEMGLRDGMLTAVLHQSGITKLEIELRFTPNAQPYPRPVPARRRFAGFADLLQRLWDTVLDLVEHCDVPFGQVTFAFSKGSLRTVEVTKKFKVEKEMAELSRVLFPPEFVPGDEQRPDDPGGPAKPKPR